MTKNTTESQITVLGFPTEWGNLRHLGKVHGAPAALRTHGLLNALSKDGHELYDIGDIECENPKTDGSMFSDHETRSHVLALSRAVKETVGDHMRRGRKIIAIGGDHSMAMGTVSGALEARNGKIGIIWIDAHADMHTIASSVSGNIHGMPLAYVSGSYADTLSGITEDTKKISSENILLVGANDIDEAEHAILKQRNIAVCDMQSMRQKNGEIDLGAAKKIIEEIAKRTDGLWVSIDVDGIDAEDAPATPMQNRKTGADKGLTGDAVKTLATYIAETNRVLGMDIAEYMPEQEQNGKTAKLIIDIARILMQNTSEH